MVLALDVQVCDQDEPADDGLVPDAGFARIRAANPNELWVTDITESGIPAGKGVPAAGHRPLRRHARRLNVRAIVANDHSDNEVQQNVTAPSRYVTHLRIGNAVRDLNLVPHGISVSDWSKSHNRSLRRIGSADGPLTSTPYLAADEVRSLG